MLTELKFQIHGVTGYLVRFGVPRWLAVPLALPALIVGTIFAPVVNPFVKGPKS